jgi:hypothetical protein
MYVYFIIFVKSGVSLVSIEDISIISKNINNFVFSILKLNF